MFYKVQKLEVGKDVDFAKGWSQHVTVCYQTGLNKPTTNRPEKHQEYKPTVVEVRLGLFLWEAETKI